MLPQVNSNTINQEPRPTAPILELKQACEGGFLFQFKVPEDLLFFEGHFPGTPVVAGVCQIKWVCDVIREHFQRELPIAGMEAVKFHQLLFPGQSFRMEIKHQAKRRKWSFRLFYDQKKVASGRILEGE